MAVHIHTDEVDSAQYETEGDGSKPELLGSIEGIKLCLIGGDGNILVLFLVVVELLHHSAECRGKTAYGNSGYACAQRSHLVAVQL